MGFRFIKHQKKRVLFSVKEDWEKWIRNALDYQKYTCHFLPLNNADLTMYDLVVPLTIQDIRFLNRAYTGDASLPFIVPSTRVLDLCDDKSLLNTYLRTHGYDDFIPEAYWGDGYPYILKKKTDEWGVNSHVISDPQQETLYAEERQSDDYFCQEYIPGNEEYTTHFLMHEGRIRFHTTICFSFDRSVYIKGKWNREKQFSHLNSTPHLSLFENILQNIRYNGIGCFNYKRKDGRPQIFEINPRYGASMTHTLNPLLRIYHHRLNKPVSKPLFERFRNRNPLIRDQEGKMRV